MKNVNNKINIRETYDLEHRDSIFFENCKNCYFIIPKKINKIIIYNCQNTRFEMNNVISSLEIVKCSELYVLIYGKLMTTQLDFVKDSDFHYLYSNGFVISCGTDNVRINTQYHNLILPYHMFLQQYITNINTWIVKTREECLDPEGYLLLE